jgi:pyruvate,orthophosphate dikinase
MSKKWVYLFDEVEEAEKYVGGEWDGVRALLGGKGANLADMTRAGVPVPPGYTVTMLIWRTIKNFRKDCGSKNWKL